MHAFRPAPAASHERDHPARPVRAVFFDVGETLVDESTEYGTWADWLGVSRHTFSAVFGQVISQGRDHREVFQHFRPGFDLGIERERRAQAGLAEHFSDRDVYPDVRECLAGLKADGFFLGVAGNQPARSGRLLHELHLGVDLIATSDDWAVEKPSVGFFTRLVESCGLEPAEIAYVGDRLDNDILPAAEAGLITVFIRRGPWGFHYATHPEIGRADIRIDGLVDLPARLREWNRAAAA